MSPCLDFRAARAERHRGSLIANWRALAGAAEATALEDLFWLRAGRRYRNCCGVVIVVRFERFGRALYPLIVLFQNVPKVALAPIFILWFGFDLAPKIVLIVVIAFFPVAIDMLAGLAIGRAVLCGADAVGRRQPEQDPASRAHSAFAAASDGRAQGRNHFQRHRRHCRRVCRRQPRPRLRDRICFHALDTPLIFAALIVVSVLGLAFLLHRRACGTSFGAVGSEIRRATSRKLNGQKETAS